MNGPYWVYVLKSPQDAYYVGRTNDLARRLHRHQTSETRGKAEYELLCFMPAADYSDMMATEWNVAHAIRDNGHTVNAVWPFTASLNHSWGAGEQRSPL